MIFPINYNVGSFLSHIRLITGSRKVQLLRHSSAGSYLTAHGIDLRPSDLTAYETFALQKNSLREFCMHLRILLCKLDRMVRGVELAAEFVA